MNDKSDTSAETSKEAPAKNPPKTYTVAKASFILGRHYAKDKPVDLTDGQAAPFLRGGQIEAPKSRSTKAKD
ncbi:hypothetical protein [Palleronia sp.]|uniref:hypothetical protein n=1 Tax=Palleronia sp. TaxID=1940284 RepID=UPI0035C82044